MKIALVLACGVPISLGAGWLALASAPAPDTTCDEGRVPIVWPLGPTGFDPRQLRTSHGQYLKLPAWPPFVHRGIDIAACEGDEVFAIEAGVVEYVSFGDVVGYNQVVIADADEEDVGWSYLHLEDVYVSEGDVVQRDQAIGTVTDFPEYDAFDHLHLQRVAPSTDGGSMADGQVDAGNPLPMLAPRSDDSPPQVLALTAGPPAEHMRFEKDGSAGTVIAPGALIGTPIDVVARVQELFPGSGAPACSIGICADPVVASEIMPTRISFSIFRTVDAPSGISYPDTVRERVFHNVIDLDLALVVDGELTKGIYHTDSLGDYTTREFLMVLTHCQVSGQGSFEFTGPGEYLLQLVLEDASGNATVQNRTIDIP